MATTEEQRIGEDLKKIEWEPLLPIEKKLIVWSPVPPLPAVGTERAALKDAAKILY